MKKMMMFAACAAMVGMVAGCFTSATAHTEKTNPDGTKTVSRVSIIGTGDKVSQVAADGLYADGAADDLGAGVKKASASQQSTGIDGTLRGVGDLLGGIAAVMRAYPAAGAAQTAVPDGYTFAAATTYDMAPTEYNGSPGENGIGVYGKSGCGRCAAYAAAHPDVAVIDIGNEQYRKTMWDALKGRFKFTGTNVNLPVVITADGFTQAAH
jgi:hypothetical protein